MVILIREDKNKLAENKAWSEMTYGEGPTRINTMMKSTGPHAPRPALDLLVLLGPSQKNK